MRSKPSVVLKRLMRELQLCRRTEELEVISLLKSQAGAWYVELEEVKKENQQLKARLLELETGGKS